MLEAIKFIVSGTSKDHPFCIIKDGIIYSTNGLLTLSSPIDLNLTISPKVNDLIKAVEMCEDTISMHVTPKGKLSIKSGGFKALIECSNEQLSQVKPQGEIIPLNGNLLSTLRLLNSFVAGDVSQIWAKGILFKGKSAFATNNIVLIEYWLDCEFPVQVNIPKTAIIELLRINQEPVSLQMNENNITFHYENGGWLRTQTYDTTWPDISKILSEPRNPISVRLIEQEIIDITPFVNSEKQYLFLKSDGTISTVSGDNEAGASLQVPAIKWDGCFNHGQLKQVLKIADDIDLSAYPAPCPFFGDYFRGAIIGMRL